MIDNWVTQGLNSGCWDPRRRRLASTVLRPILLLVMIGPFLPNQFTPTSSAAEATFGTLTPAFEKEITPLLRRFCFQCHSGDRVEAEIELDAFRTMTDVRRQTDVWQKVGEMLDSRQMPPPDALQPSDELRRTLQSWVREYLSLEAKALAGDPGPVVLRRLSNSEYTYTIRELTGIHTLDPAREFPVDGAAGEGFTNTGSALVMSPSLVTKYLDAAKEVAEHSVLLPNGFRFSPHQTRRDWTNEILDRIRTFYQQFTDSSGGTSVNLQSIQFDTNQGGRLPIEKYFAATLQDRKRLESSPDAYQNIAHDRKLNAKYIQILWEALDKGIVPANTVSQDSQTSPAENTNSILLNQLRGRWRSAKSGDEGSLSAEVAQWQRVLWKFNSIGHIGREFGREGGPTAWMEATSPSVSQQEFRLKIPQLTSQGGEDDVINLYLATNDAADGHQTDYVVWEQPRFVMPGRADIGLRDIRVVTAELASQREAIVQSTSRCLAAAAERLKLDGQPDIQGLSRKYQVNPEHLSAWLEYLGIGGSGPAQLGSPITKQTESVSGYGFVQGWVGEDALSVLANSSDNAVRIPGNMKPHSIAVHPAPKLSVAVGWRAPRNLAGTVSALVQHAHPECGNGVVWTVEHRHGNTRQRLETGTSKGATEIKIGPLAQVQVRAGDAIVLVIGPRDGNHSCDLTAIDLTISDGTTDWNLARDVSPNILQANPHPDAQGNPETWHFFSEPAGSTAGHVIPPESLLAKWLASDKAEEQTRLAAQVQQLMLNGYSAARTAAPLKSDADKSDKRESADLALYRQLTSLSGPLLSAALRAISKSTPGASSKTFSKYGLDSELFGTHPAADKSGPSSQQFQVDGAHLCVRAPWNAVVPLPKELVAGAEFVVTARLHSPTAKEGSVQVSASLAKPDSTRLMPAPILTTEESQARKRFESAFDDFRRLFPPALCYTKIVPVDEVVTLTLFYREDEHLRRLMLNAQQVTELEQMWQELFYVSQEPFLFATAFEQIYEFATQDRPDMVKAFAPMRKPINDRAQAFQQRLVADEPAQLESLIRFASHVFRRPLSDNESRQFGDLYKKMREEGIGHQEAFRALLARQLVSPAFLYRIEVPGTGPAQSPVNDWELANRLSYFLWSSPPDVELAKAAAEGKLQQPDALRAQIRRMVPQEKTRRFAIEFGCQWLQIRDFDQHDEKSERHFPTFADVRGAMYEESIRFLTDLFQNDRSILSILDADHAILNARLAAHYEIPWPKEQNQPEWLRLDGVKKYTRGGVLSQGSVLSKQSGASRTSPILRGNWLSEVMLGDKLPRPPKDVPQLPDDVPAAETERQLIERHSSDPACAKCHARIDPLGFALEQFDAIGRFRERDSADRMIDPKATLLDGSRIEGLTGLKKYLLEDRRDAFVRQFCRKLLGYALGRSVQLSDEPLLAEMQANLKANGYRYSNALEVVVLSRQFRDTRGREWGVVGARSPR